MKTVAEMRRIAAQLEERGGPERIALAERIIALAAELDDAQVGERAADALEVEAAKRRSKLTRGNGRDRVVKPLEQAYMPGALPQAARRAVGKDVSAIFDKVGNRVVTQALEQMHATVGQMLEAAKEEVKQTIQHQYGARGLAEYSSFLGEWAEAVVADLFEHGLNQMSQRAQRSVDTAGRYYSANGDPIPAGVADIANEIANAVAARLGLTQPSGAAERTARFQGAIDRARSAGRL